MLGRLHAMPFLLGLAILMSPSSVMGASYDIREMTFTQMLNEFEFAVVARLSDSTFSGNAEEKASKTRTFTVIDVVNGEKTLARCRLDARILSGTTEGDLFFIVGYKKKSSNEVDWCVTKSMSDECRQHILSISELNDNGIARLAFFQRFLDHADPLIAANAHREFIQATDEAFETACKAFNRKTIRQWLSKPNIAIDRKCLYLAMLARCGNNADTQWLEPMLSQDIPQTLLSVKIACFLALKGEAGLPVVNQRLGSSSTDFIQSYSAIMALRFVSDLPNSKISTESIISSFRLALNDERLANLVVPDLARLKDWESLDRLVELYKTAPTENWIRTPVAHFVLACPSPTASERLKELDQIDPAAVHRAKTFLGSAPASERKRATLRRHYSGKSGC